jgi:membrane-associated phospholipid phosphatase
LRSLALALCFGTTLVVRSALAEEPAAAVPPPPLVGAEPATGPAPALATTPAPPVPGQDLPGPPLVWKWAPFSIGDWAVTLTGGGLTLAMAIVKPVPMHKMSGGILFDEAARSALRPDRIYTRYGFRDASDVGVSLLATWPFFADALTTAWWYRGSRDVAEQMALIDLQTLAITGAVQGVTNVVVSRERPYGRDCGSSELPEEALDCVNSTHYRSFFSGHSAFSFASAALICIHHFQNDLLGPPWDAISCTGGYAVAASTALFRVVGDVHYTSDIITGALVGTAIGYGVPLLHYARKAGAGLQVGEVRVDLVPAAGGLGLAGVF